jgi:uncharacterized membrane protein YobD (UPF0266 family)
LTLNSNFFFKNIYFNFNPVLIPQINKNENSILVQVLKKVGFQFQFQKSDLILVWVLLIKPKLTILTCRTKYELNTNF